MTYEAGWRASKMPLQNRRKAGNIWRKMAIRIGISGWTYAGWRGVFYPKDLPHRRELEHASRQLSSIEINGTFYSLQRPSSYEAWHAATPPGFRFAVKGSRFITHMKQLNDIRIPLANFLASGVLRLEEKLGPILWQFPAKLSYNEQKFIDFLELLPRSTKEAARLARKHDERLEGRRWLKTRADRPLQHAFEVRHPSFLVPEFMDLLRHHNAAFVFSDSSGEWPYAEDVTANFVYLRLHGAEELYASGYDDASLREWARKIKAWANGQEPSGAQRVGRKSARRAKRDVYVYFDNDRKVRAPFDALRLMDMLNSDSRKRAA
jgi:uncharacterized protein YecE (DUF72 family)